MARKSGTRKDPFADDYRPYGINKGARGTPSQWKEAFKDRFSAEEARDILGRETVARDGEWAILGVAVDAPWDDVKRAYRKLAMISHPDVGGDPEAFKKIHAAYSLIAHRYGMKA